MPKQWSTCLSVWFRASIRGAGLALVATALVASIVTTFLVTPTANAQNVPTTQNEYGTNTSSCAIETVGWIICPVMRTIARLGDYGFAFINSNYLSIDVSIFNDGSGTAKAYQIFLGIASGLFVVAFLMVIYSQITGRNPGNYNIKRILPRLIIGAVLIFTSAIACRLAIDASNIVGGSILAIITGPGGVLERIGQSAMPLNSAASGFDSSRLTDITSGILTKPGTVWILLAPVAAVTIGIAIISAAGLILLIMRKVLVAMLFIVSPIVLVAFLLPNLERYMQIWGRLFFQMLLLYPIIALLLGAGQIVSATIINAGSSKGNNNYAAQDDSYNSRGVSSGSAMTDLAAAGAAALPLLGAWFALKGATAFLTNTGGKLADRVGRGLSKDQEAKLKAKLDSKESQKLMAGGLPKFDRGPAFNRTTRRRERADNGPLAKLGTKSGEPIRVTLVPPTPAGVLGAANDLSASLNGADKLKADGKLGADGKPEQTDANGNPVVAALGNAKQKDEKSGKSAKDIFNNMNHQKAPSKDQQRSFGTGPAPAGGGGGSAPAAGPTPQYAAPSMMQTHSMPQAQAPQAAAPAAQIVSIDTSSLLTNNSGGGNSDSIVSAPGQNGALQPPSSDIQKKAKARAQQYMFESVKPEEKDITSRGFDPFMKRPHADEPPHSEPKDPKDKDD